MGKKSREKKLRREKANEYMPVQFCKKWLEAVEQNNAKIPSIEEQQEIIEVFKKDDYGVPTELSKRGIAFFKAYAHPEYSSFLKVHVDLATMTDIRSSNEMRAFLNALATTLTASSWLKNKQVYKFDGKLLEELKESIVNDNCFNVAQLKYLPNTCFCIETDKEYILCKIVNMDDEWEIMSSFLTKTEKFDDLTFNIDFLQLSDGSFKLNFDEHNAFYVSLFGALSYLATVNADVQREKLNNSASKKCKKNTNNTIYVTEPEVQIWEVGYRYGAAVRKFEAEAKQREEAKVGKSTAELKTRKVGYHVRPHMRRGYMGHRWYGPRHNPERRELRQVWINPSMINVSFDKNHVIEGDVVVHKVY